MALLSLLRQYRNTRTTLRQGASLWERSEADLRNEKLLNGRTLNRIQNAVSTLWAIPFIYIGSIGAADVEWFMAAKLGCEKQSIADAWYVQLAATMTAVALVVATPTVMARVASFLSRSQLPLEKSRAAYLYINAISTAKSKTALLVLVNLLWIAIAAQLFFENLYARTGRGFPGTQEDMAAQGWFYFATTALPSITVALLFLFPLIFYVRFLARYSAFAASADLKATILQVMRNGLAAKTFLTLIGAASILFALILVLPLLVRAALYMAACGTLLPWIEWQLWFLTR